LVDKVVEHNGTPKMLVSSMGLLCPLIWMDVLLLLYQTKLLGLK